jgi:hypothetical protein
MSPNGAIGNSSISPGTPTHSATREPPLHNPGSSEVSQYAWLYGMPLFEYGDPHVGSGIDLSLFHVEPASLDQQHLQLFAALLVPEERLISDEASAHPRTPASSAQTRGQDAADGDVWPLDHVGPHRGSAGEPQRPQRMDVLLCLLVFAARGMPSLPCFPVNHCVQ